MSHLEFSEDLRDAFTEIANIAVGQTADKIARSFSAFVVMPIPRVHLLESADILMALTAMDGEESVSAVTQAFYATGISGEALLLFGNNKLGGSKRADLSRLMGYDDNGDEREQFEHMLEMASLLNGSCIQSVLAQLEIDVLIGHPVVLGVRKNLTEMFAGHKFPWDKTLAIELNYTFEGFSTTCDLVLLFHQNALPVLFKQLAVLLA
jgi:chemotaxis protein CheY-P-specific phosphatase CheC